MFIFAFGHCQCCQRHVIHVQPPFNIGCSLLLFGHCQCCQIHVIHVQPHVAKVQTSLSLSLRHTFRWCALYFYWKIKWMCHPWWTNLRWFLIFPWYMWFMFEPFFLSLSLEGDVPYISIEKSNGCTILGGQT